ncbi:MAG: asparagine synthase-related protein [Candidatus Spyradocola sp.]
MMERQILVATTGGSEGVAMLKGIRSAGVFCVMTDARQPVIPPEARGIVLIGAARSDIAQGLRAMLDTGLPMLAFGAPAAQLCEALGGSVTGHAFDSQLKDVRFANLGVCAGVEGGMRMLCGAEYLSLPQGFRTLSVSEGAILGFDDGQGLRMGFQFVPETHDLESSEIIGNFLWQVAGLQPNYSCESYAEQAVASIRARVGDGQAVCVLSGGVDSATAACLARRAVGDRLHCLVIDTSLNRAGEVERIQEAAGRMGLSIRLINAQGRVMEQLRGCVTPQQKREAVAGFLNRRIADEVERLGGRVVVVQGTNYAEILQNEQAGSLPGDIPVERPLELLFKDEVRELAQLMGVPEQIAQRQHYPIAGIALRCVGPVDADKLSALRTADALLRQTLEEAGQRRQNAMAFAVLTDLTDAFADDQTRYVVVLRAVQTASDRASVQRLPQDVLERAAERIMAEAPGVYRVVFDVTPVPPATIEWE